MAHTKLNSSLLIALLLVPVMCGCRSRIGGVDTNDDGVDDGRVPRCLEDEGIDLFAAKGDEVLAVSWNNLGRWDAAGGYRLWFGTSEVALSGERLVDCTDFECELALTPLENGVEYFLVVESLDESGVTTYQSCTVSATPHPLAFLPDLRVHVETTGVQDFPDIVAQHEGVPLFIAWEDGGTIRVARSVDLGATWKLPVTVGSGSGQASPALGFRDQLEETVEQEDGTVSVVVVGEPLVFLAFAEGDRIMLVRARFPDGLTNPATFEAPVPIGTGTNPDIASGMDAIYVAFESVDAIVMVSVNPDSLEVGEPVRVDTGTGDAHAPAIATHPSTGDVFVGYHAHRGPGDFNVYLNVSTDGGSTFPAEEVRIDDDTTGQNQLNISLAVDGRTGQVLATWEDRRRGANVYFSSSEDNGETWLPNIQTGAGLAGDQFTPHAVIDPGRNIYVIFTDTSDGQKPMFSRFNPDRTFDPPLPVSTAAGKAGAAARNPAVHIDRFGTIYATWAENRSSPNVDIYFARAE